ncbi:MAG: CheR family methyltransferase [Alphaproteobacteria bacterium]
MKDEDCVSFLRWALPRLGFRWPGFRKVRRQVCKRVRRRLNGLDLPDVAAYRRFLESTPGEWPALDALCRIPISRFWRDRGVFDHLAAHILPRLANEADRSSKREIRAWSAGCASGEEPYSLAIAWELGAALRFPRLSLQILATDADAALLERATRAVYPRGSLKDLPQAFRDAAFEETNGQYRLRERFRAPALFRCEDIRTAMPEGPFDLVLCRNLAFTYFDEAGQRAALEKIAARLSPGGYLVIGAHEKLPKGAADFAAEPNVRGVSRLREEARP